MPFERIESLDDARVGAYRAVPEPELLRERGLFIAEGRLVLQRVVEDGRFAIRSVLVNEAARRDRVVRAGLIAAGLKWQQYT